VSVPTIVAVMLAGYLLVMGLLAFATRAMGAPPRPPSAWGRAEAPAWWGRRGWPALIRRVAATALGGYLLLMAVVFGYYYGVARVGSDFLVNAVTGTAMLIGLSLPLFLAASWLVERRRRTRVRVRARARRKPLRGTRRRTLPSPHG
jgi:hypothetical protein